MKKKIELLDTISMHKLGALAERYEELVKEAKALEAEIVALIGGGGVRRRGRKGRPPKGISIPGRKGKKGRKGRKAKGAKGPKGRKGKKGNRGQKPGALKGRILSVLESAGEGGATVADIASQLAVPKANVHVWFSTTGKRLKEVKKLEPGRFCYSKKK